MQILIHQKNEQRQANEEEEQGREQGRIHVGEFFDQISYYVFGRRPAPGLADAEAADKENRPAQSIERMAANELAKCSQSQRVLIRHVLAGSNVFFTGAAGTGKSYCLHVLRRLLCVLYPGFVSVTSSTGITAVHLSGCTLHAWAAIPMRIINIAKTSQTQAVSEAAALISRSASALSRWTSTRVLFVDELSMVDGDFLDLVEAVARQVRRSERPFGGIQLVLSGDFYQLPPVVKGSEEPRFAFDCLCWPRLGLVSVVLADGFRQTAGNFQDALNNVRTGQPTSEDMQLLISRQSAQRHSSDSGLDAMRRVIRSLSAGGERILPTLLLTKRADADALNAGELAALAGPPVMHTANDQGDESVLSESCVARKSIELRVGCQVILLKNIDVAAGLSNGSRGLVTRFTKAHNFPVVRFFNGVERAIQPEKFDLFGVGCRVQLPLELGWAITIHKSQGMSLDTAIVDVSQVWLPGQAYVAMSRVRTLEGLHIIGLTRERIIVDQRVNAFYRQLVSKGTPPPPPMHTAKRASQSHEQAHANKRQAIDSDRRMKAAMAG